MVIRTRYKIGQLVETNSGFFAPIIAVTVDEVGVSYELKADAAHGVFVKEDDIEAVYVPLKKRKRLTNKDKRQQELPFPKGETAKTA